MRRTDSASRAVAARACATAWNSDAVRRSWKRERVRARYRTAVGRRRASRAHRAVRVRARAWECASACFLRPCVDGNSFLGPNEVRMSTQPIADRSQIAPGRTLRVDYGGDAVLLCNVEGTIHAIEDVCTHDGGELDQGELDGCRIECPRHGAYFDVIDRRRVIDARDPSGSDLSRAPRRRRDLHRRLNGSRGGTSRLADVRYRRVADNE